MNTLTTKYRMHLISVALLLYLSPLLIHSFSVRQTTQYFGIGILSLLSFPIGFLMGFAVLGLQVKNPLTTAKQIDYFCKGAFYFFYFGGVLLLLASLFQPSPEEIPINMLPGGFGIAFAAYKIRKKYVLEQSRTA